LSFSRNVYYDLKPFLPFGLRMAMRRLLARRQLKKSVGTWPIDPSAGTPPKNWPGWPGGKQFALVLTHDVEGPRGLANCEALMQLEMDLGFRSSFNFVPEGSYKVPAKLLNRLVENGFEVGVHDLHHNGKLYRTKRRFDAAAPRINHYLREWNAVGFRSGFMHRNLDWLHALDIEYDMSTFDTDPFEPQPDGAHTIFPFWVPAPPNTFDSALSTQHIETVSPLTETLRTSNFALRTSRHGYAELPYTLPQDSTLFFLLQERDTAIWKQKLDWIAQCGGMALLNVHPDYIDFASANGNTYSLKLYADLLNFISDRWSKLAALLLPGEVASFVKEQQSPSTCSNTLFRTA
jgi:hypothetical protein